ncbi:MAG: hypothetical protein HFI20_13245 [Lachnospiraceae bacterium]|nr:hypothetical protein [Lachnospiraceae bacterium]
MRDEETGETILVNTSSFYQDEEEGMPKEAEGGIIGELEAMLASSMRITDQD